MPNSSFFSVIYKIPAGLSGKEDITRGWTSLLPRVLILVRDSVSFSNNIVIRDAVPTAVPLLKCTHDL